MIVAGFGFRGAASHHALLDAFERACATHCADRLATAEGKAGADAMQTAAQHLALPLIAVSDADLTSQTVISRSETSMAQYRTSSVAEAAALAAAGPGARLLAPRAVSGDRMATCALAESGQST